MGVPNSGRFPRDISVCSICGTQRHDLKRLPVTEARESLGVFLSIDGDNSAKIRKLRNKAEEFADAIRTSKLSHDDAWYALNSTILKTLEYPMIAINLTEAQW